jgi:hypothetical protein
MTRAGCGNVEAYSRSFGFPCTLCSQSSFFHIRIDKGGDGYKRMSVVGFCSDFFLFSISSFTSQLPSIILSQTDLAAANINPLNTLLYFTLFVNQVDLTFFTFITVSCFTSSPCLPNTILSTPIPVRPSPSTCHRSRAPTQLTLSKAPIAGFPCHHQKRQKALLRDPASHHTIHLPLPVAMLVAHRNMILHLTARQVLIYWTT